MAVSDPELIRFALRRLAEESEDNRPKMAARMRSLASHIPISLTDDERVLLLQMLQERPPDASTSGKSAPDQPSAAFREALVRKLEQR